MEKSLDLTTIAARLCDAENESLRSSGSGRYGLHRSSITVNACMPKEVEPSAELMFMHEGEFTLLIGLNGSCNGIQFCMDGKAYKFVGSLDNIVRQRKAFVDLGFEHISPVVLKERKKSEDRKKTFPFSMNGAIVFTPQETTPQLPEYSYRKVIRPTGAIDGLVICDGNKCHYFLPGSQLVVDGAIRKLSSDYGYDPFEEK